MAQQACQTHKVLHWEIIRLMEFQGSRDVRDPREALSAFCERQTVAWSAQGTSHRETFCELSIMCVGLFIRKTVHTLLRELPGGIAAFESPILL